MPERACCHALCDIALSYRRANCSTDDTNSQTTVVESFGGVFSSTCIGMCRNRFVFANRLSDHSACRLMCSTRLSCLARCLLSLWCCQDAAANGGRLAGRLQGRERLSLRSSLDVGGFGGCGINRFEFLAGELSRAVVHLFPGGGDQRLDDFLVRMWQSLRCRSECSFWGCAAIVNN